MTHDFDSESPEDVTEDAAKDKAEGKEDGEVPNSAEIEEEIEAVLTEREKVGGEPLPAGAVTRLATHAYLMCLANAHINLTRIVKPKEIAVKHVLDSVLVTDLVNMKKARVLDIGTGAGYPGIPIAVAVPSANVVLLDGTEKKVVFVADAIEEMGLTNAAGRQGRAEVHLLDFSYDFLVARAVGPIDRLLPLLLPRRDRFDALVAMKGPTGLDEWDRAYRAGATRGFELVATHEYELPGGAGKRSVLVIGPSGTRRLKAFPSGEREKRPRFRR